MFWRYSWEYYTELSHSAGFPTKNHELISQAENVKKKTHLKLKNVLPSVYYCVFRNEICTW